MYIGSGEKSTAERKNKSRDSLLLRFPVIMIIFCRLEVKIVLFRARNEGDTFSRYS